MNVADQIVQTTVRIETQGLKDSGSGTGFFFRFCSSDASNVPVIVTNKHVIEDVSTGQFYINLKNKNANEPDIGKHISVSVADFEKNWVKHPDRDVDLAVFPIAPVLQRLNQQGHEPFYIGFDTEFLADPTFMSELSAIEDIIMIGYPIGLWDARHNLPVVRRGVTATPPYVDFDGKPQFMIDCACFPGSSGSPVLLFNSGGYVDKAGTIRIGGTRVKLLGVLCAGPHFTAQGEIRAVPVPTSVKSVALSQIPINLGYCVKADQLRWFEAHFQKLIDAEKAVAASV